MQTLCSDTVALVDSYRRAVMVQNIDGSISGLPNRRPKTSQSSSKWYLFRFTEDKAVTMDGLHLSYVVQAPNLCCSYDHWATGNLDLYLLSGRPSSQANGTWSTMFPVRAYGNIVDHVSLACEDDGRLGGYLSGKKLFG